MEAHTQDDWPLGQHVCIQAHKKLEDRIEAAKFFAESNDWPLPMFVDTMSNEFASNYKAHPERFYAIDADGKLAFKAWPENAHYPLAPLREWLSKSI